MGHAFCHIPRLNQLPLETLSSLNSTTYTYILQNVITKLKKKDCVAFLLRKRF